jgi:hypothetical protein
VEYYEIPVMSPKKCPAYGETEPWAFGRALLHLIEDEKIPGKWVIVKGWYCDELFGEHRGMVFGTAVRRGPVEECGETEPVNIVEPGCVYIVSFRPNPFGPRKPWGGRVHSTFDQPA